MSSDFRSDLGGDLGSDFGSEGSDFGDDFGNLLGAEPDTVHGRELGVPVARAPGSVPAVELTAGLPADELRQKLREANQLSETGNRMLAFYLWDMAERRLHQLSGHSSALHYAVDRLGIGARQARDLVRVGRVLRRLTRIDDAFAEGRLGWSKVRSIAEVAVESTQDAWIARARELNCRQLEHEVKYKERGETPRKRDQPGLPQVVFPIRAKLDPLGQAKWEQARQRLRSRVGRTITDDELVRMLLEEFLQGGGTRVPREPPYHVVIQKCPQCRHAAVDTWDGPVPIDRATAEMVECEAPRIDFERGEADRQTPKALREKVLKRDGERCVSCGNHYGLMVHHVRPRSAGGPTEARNLTTLCDRCHALVHAGLLAG